MRNVPQDVECCSDCVFSLPLYAERAMLFSTEILKNKSMYMEAAMQFIKMTKEV